jgi:hypothetical protein
VAELVVIITAAVAVQEAIVPITLLVQGFLHPKVLAVAVQSKQNFPYLKEQHTQLLLVLVVLAVLAGTETELQGAIQDSVILLLLVGDLGYVLLTYPAVLAVLAAVHKARALVLPAQAALVQLDKVITVRAVAR